MILSSNILYAIPTSLRRSIYERWGIGIITKDGLVFDYKPYKDSRNMGRMYWVKPGILTPMHCNFRGEPPPLP